MKKFVVLLEYPKVFSQEIEAKNERDLIQKIEAGIYSVLPIHGKKPIKITRDNINMIYEQSFGARLMEFAVKQIVKVNFKKGILWSFYKIVLQKIYNLGRWDDLPERLKKGS